MSVTPKKPELVPDDAATRVMEAADRMFTYIKNRAEAGDVEAQLLLADIFQPREQR